MQIHTSIHTNTYTHTHISTLIHTHTHIYIYVYLPYESYIMTNDTHYGGYIAGVNP